MGNISIILAFSAGLASFLSPCVLPLVPAYIGYITGTTVNSADDKKPAGYVLYKSLGFILGFSIIFILMGASITALSKVFFNYKAIFRRTSGILIIIFGLHTTGIFKIKLFYREKKFFTFDKAQGTFASVLLGMAFAAGWTPCIGPILSSILLYAGNMETQTQGIILLVFYSLGLGVPFVIAALAVDKLSAKLRNLGKYLEIISITSGIIMIIMGILIFTNKVGILTSYLTF